MWYYLLTAAMTVVFVIFFFNDDQSHEAGKADIGVSAFWGGFISYPFWESLTKGTINLIIALVVGVITWKICNHVASKKQRF